MPVYRIADLDILINPIYENTIKRLFPYITNSENYDFEISLTEDEKNSLDENGFSTTTTAVTEDSIILQRLCCTILESYNGFFFHSSSVMVDGNAYVFSAPSGTGKSTHTALWRKYFGDKAVMINDDKPIIRKHNGSFYIYGTPWMGKSNIGNNIKAPVKAIYFLERSKENSAVKVSTGSVFREILEATVVPQNKATMHTLLSTLDEFFSTTQIFKLKCNMDIDAVKTAFNAVNDYK